MHLRLTKVWYTLRSSFWFLPALMAVGLAFAVAYLDQRLGQTALFAVVPAPFRWVINTSGQSARSVLEAIADGMIAMPLSLASIRSRKSRGARFPPRSMILTLH